MNQDVMEHKVEAKKPRTEIVEGAAGEMPAIKRKTKGGFEMTSRLTKRAIARILVAVQNKLYQMVNDATQSENLDPALVREAMEHPQTQLVTQGLIAGKKIYLVHPKRRNTRLFETQMQIIGEKGEQAARESPSAKQQEDFFNMQANDDGANIDPDQAKLVSLTAISRFNFAIKFYFLLKLGCQRGRDQPSCCHRDQADPHELSQEPAHTRVDELSQTLKIRTGEAKAR